MILIIGYGNSLREDDCAGPILAETLARTCRQRHLLAEELTLHQLLPELVPIIAGEDVEAVVFVDTQVAPDSNPAVTIRPMTATGGSPSVGHSLSPDTLLLYAKLLYGKQPPAWLVTIPGVSFNHGQTLSPLTRRALALAPVETLVNQLAAQVQMA